MECKNKECVDWEEGRNEEDCIVCVDGRWIDVVSVYASTCDGCGELTSHEEMLMDEETQLGYCFSRCAKEHFTAEQIASALELD